MEQSKLHCHYMSQRMEEYAEQNMLDLIAANTENYISDFIIDLHWFEGENRNEKGFKDNLVLISRKNGVELGYPDAVRIQCYLQDHHTDDKIYLIDIEKMCRVDEYYLREPDMRMGHYTYLRMPDENECCFYEVDKHLNKISVEPEER